MEFLGPRGISKKFQTHRFLVCGFLARGRGRIPLFSAYPSGARRVMSARSSCRASRAPARIPMIHRCAGADPDACALTLTTVSFLGVHPVRNPRFGSFRTQPLAILSADSEFMCCYLLTKGCLGNPTLGTNLGQQILAMRTGCSAPSVLGARGVGAARGSSRKGLCKHI